MRVYIDIVYADYPDGKSTEAFIIMYVGVLVMWVSKKQTFVSTSTLISEFCIFMPVLKQAIWVKRLLVRLGLEDNTRLIPFYSDSQNALNVFVQRGYTKSTCWINNCYFFVKDEIEKGTIQLFC